MPKQLLDITEGEDGLIHISPYNLISPFIRRLSEFVGESIMDLEGSWTSHERMVLELKDGKKLVIQTGDVGEAWIIGFEKDEKIS